MSQELRRACAGCGISVYPGVGFWGAGRLFCSQICADIQDPAFNDPVGREAGTAAADERREPRGGRAADLRPALEELTDAARPFARFAFSDLNDYERRFRAAVAAADDLLRGGQ